MRTHTADLLASSRRDGIYPESMFRYQPKSDTFLCPAGVLDIAMPRLDGIEAARQLRRSERPARLVFLTVYENADYARAALDAGGLCR